jgi:hypothetical protein
MEEGVEGSYRHGHEEETGRLKGGLRGGELLRPFPVREGEEFPVKKNLARGSHRSVRRKRKERGRKGCWAGSGRIGPVVSRARPSWAVLPFFCSELFFFLFLFSISFITFAKMLQINSNHFQEFSKIQSIKVGQ